ncbi:MAG TPA: NADH-quinone oxidoreductase subunit D, partial [Ktedonobacterales bacterium]|nr:NADH-quinone oxidoreductase subunit D [Ktedonobacterales bacterium]
KMEEMEESVRLVRMALDQLPGGSICQRTPIALRPPRGETYASVESARGEESVYMISDGSEYPYRAKIRAPSFTNLQILPELLRGHKIGDVIAILGSIDIVLGDVDR